MKIYKCLVCANMKEDENGEFTCPAFPEGIPQEKIEEEGSKDKPCKGKIKFIDSLGADK